jgi:hypothetical protein
MLGENFYFLICALKLGKSLQNFQLQEKIRELSDVNNKLTYLRKENTKKEKEISERKQELEHLQDQLGKAKEENANKSIELRNLQMDLGRVNSELLLSQRESYERSRILQETLHKLDNMRNTVKDAKEINSYKAKELKDKSKNS